MRRINVLVIQRISKEARERIAAVDSRIELTDAGGWFDDEIREAWGDYATSRALPSSAAGSGTRAERNRLLEGAEIIVGGWPFPRDLRSRAPQLKWFHQLQAGASNLLGTDLWNSDVVVTTSRGVANSLPIAEFALAGILHFAKSLSRAVVDHQHGTFDRNNYRPLSLQSRRTSKTAVAGVSVLADVFGLPLPKKSQCVSNALCYFVDRYVEQKGKLFLVIAVPRLSGHAISVARCFSKTTRAVVRARRKTYATSLFSAAENPRIKQRLFKRALDKSERSRHSTLVRAPRSGDRNYL